MSENAQNRSAENRTSNPATTSSAPIRVSSLKIENFRLLRNVDVKLSEKTTVLVGRNNTGKTSLAEVLGRFLQSKDFGLTLADFSSATYDKFREACEEYVNGDNNAARSALPAITLTITIAYDRELTEYGPLSALIVDLDPDCTEAKVKFSYALEGGKLDELFDGIEADPETGKIPDTTSILATIGERIPSLFERTIFAIDPNDTENTRAVTIESVRKLVTVDFLKAQRGLDDEKERPKDLIGKIFESLFVAASKAENDSARRQTADELTKAVVNIESDLGAKVDKMVAGVIPTLKQFGYPGINDQEISTKTTLDIEKLLSNYTSVHYRGVAGVSLPEAYSGLGSRNLVMILLTLLSYYRDYAVRGNTPGIHLVFVEEPEAHLHPQMQEVFIEQLAALKKLFPTIDRTEQRWDAQFLVSTHSSHVANKASFSAIRYFRLKSGQSKSMGKHSDVLDLSKARNVNENFLHQYLTLTRSDLFFADKAILVEGTSERLIVPKAIEKLDQQIDGVGLSSQYVTLLEVGGAYAHIFFPILEFLGLPSLIITDIDTVGEKNDNGKRVRTPVHSSERTSNATIKKWFSDADVTPEHLLAQAETVSIKKETLYLAYQVPEVSGQACGRSFEDAFILANQELFDFTLTDNVICDEMLAKNEAEAHKKSTFALKYSIEEDDWHTPRYIQQGLEWLLNYPSPVAIETDNASEGQVAVK
ncbi:ATP-dependent endonuclease [Kocuria arenosa]|uniref:ATP-dependent nuclease n=1 Tax=Kocuria arenosa TaxID=3071446 RepID=UPI0034D6A384